MAEQVTFYQIVRVLQDGTCEPVMLVDHPIKWAGRGNWTFPLILKTWADADDMVAKLNKKSGGHPQYQWREVDIMPALKLEFAKGAGTDIVLDKEN